MAVRNKIVCAFVAAGVAFSSTAVAQGPGNPGLPSRVTAAFIADPGQLLASSPHGGVGLTTRIRDLLTSDKNTLSAIIGLLPGANDDQQKAILEGLVQAANAYLTTDRDFASTTIPQAIAKLGDVISKRYADAAGDTATGSTGSGGGGGGAGGGGGQTTAGNTATGGANQGSPPDQPTPTPNSSRNLLTGGGSAGSASYSPISASAF